MRRLDKSKFSQWGSRKKELMNVRSTARDTTAI